MSDKAKVLPFPVKPAQSDQTGQHPSAAVLAPPRADFAVWHCVNSCGAIVSSPQSWCLGCAAQETE